MYKIQFLPHPEYSPFKKKRINKLMWIREKSQINVRISSSSSSSPSSYICHAVRPLVDPFRSHVFRSLFKGLP